MAFFVSCFVEHFFGAVVLSLSGVGLWCCLCVVVIASGLFSQWTCLAFFPPLTFTNQPKKSLFKFCSALPALAEARHCPTSSLQTCQKAPASRASVSVSCCQEALAQARHPIYFAIKHWQHQAHTLQATDEKRQRDAIPLCGCATPQEQQNHTLGHPEDRLLVFGAVGHKALARSRSRWTGLQA